jgi:hypothetical protein
MTEPGFGELFQKFQRKRVAELRAGKGFRLPLARL